MADPIIQMTDASIRDLRRPTESQMAPAARAPMKDPADIEAVIYTVVNIN
jgi:hypothetical protein